MNFDLTDDQEALRDGIRSLCTGRFDMARNRAGFDRSVWDELAETGVFSLIADGFGWADAAIAFEELGRALVPGPLVWGVLTHGLLDDLDGGVVGGVERPIPDTPDQPAGPVMLEHLDALDALVALDPGGVARIDLAELVAGEPLDWPLDPLTPVHRVAVLPAGELIADAGTARQWQLAGAVLTAAYQVGMAHACVERATGYSLERYQFDRPVGSFQAIKHMLADALVRAEVARTAVHAAAVTLDDPEVGHVARAVAGAKLLAGEAALKNARTAVQVHGGMGFTWEVDMHLYLKRAWVLDTVFGTPDETAGTVAATVGPKS
ncbi:MAG TPA: acyl-CoA dehydrogenase family protein [Acidimicrobiia bacterium]|nr:acyl-CoA dehydrogenase family protein [Acidimicrobiia bacterium]